MRLTHCGILTQRVNHRTTGEQAMGTQVRAAVLTNYFEVASQLGLDPQPLLREVGLSRSLLADPEQRIAITAAIRLLEESARVSGCITFGLRMAETRQLGDFGVISLLITHQRTLRDALNVLIEYRHLLNESLAIHVEDAGRTVVLREEVVTGTAHASRQATELAIATLARMCSNLLGNQWHPVSVSFTHSSPADLQAHRRIFQCALDFSAEFNGIVCMAADLDRPNPRADPQMARHAERLVSTLPGITAPSILLDVRRAIHISLPMGRANIELAAESLGINVRTLQRRLDDAGKTFSDLVNEARRELVETYMENPRYPLRSIAELLGYSTLSSFTRWFTAQFGMPPATWRAQRKPASAPVQVGFEHTGD
jgi:AraC-like DNA-binding protein